MKKEDLIKKMENMGFIKNNDYSITDIDEGNSATMKGMITEKSINPYNIAHGGFIFGLGDTVMGVVAASTGRQAVTLSANINYLKKAKGKFLIAKAEIIKQGKTTCYVQTNIYNDKDELVATMDSNYFFVE